MPKLRRGAAPALDSGAAAADSPALSSTALMDQPAGLHSAQPTNHHSHGANSASSASTKARFTLPALPRDAHHPSARKARPAAAVRPAARFVAAQPDDESANRQAELFYMQKQIQLQTQMVIVMEDGEHLHGIIEWYDRHSIKLRGKSRVLIYKAGIKYLYKAGETGMDSDH